MFRPTPARCRSRRRRRERRRRGSGRAPPGGSPSRRTTARRRGTRARQSRRLQRVGARPVGLGREERRAALDNSAAPAAGAARSVRTARPSRGDPAPGCRGRESRRRQPRGGCPARSRGRPTAERIVIEGAGEAMMIAGPVLDHREFVDPPHELDHAGVEFDHRHAADAVVAKSTSRRGSRRRPGSAHQRRRLHHRMHERFVVAVLVDARQLEVAVEEEPACRSRRRDAPMVHTAPATRCPPRRRSGWRRNRCCLP